MSHEERFVSRRYVDVAGHRWRCDFVCVSDLREREHQSYGESDYGCARRDTARDFIVVGVSVLHSIVLRTSSTGWGTKVQIAELRETLATTTACSYQDALSPLRGFPYIVERDRVAPRPEANPAIAEQVAWLV